MTEKASLRSIMMLVEVKTRLWSRQVDVGVVAVHLLGLVERHPSPKENTSASLRFPGVDRPSF
jgi:hypothetical protein